ncbi:MAG: hypothetical protein LBP63_11395 [Prevotellaceae bacterium]|jgi:hypothetical protein|nr:hypothetical protein [Prevotellaceae bacterium]
MKQINLLTQKVNILLIAILFVSATVFTSCESDDVKAEQPYFYIEEDYSNLIIEHTAYNSSSPYSYYTVRAIGEWQIIPVEEYDWCQAFPDRGKDEGLFRIIAKANDALTQRMAYFKIIAGGAEQPVWITLTQKANEPYITVTVRNEQGAKESKDIVNIEGVNDQTFYMFVKSNVQWDVTAGDNTGSGEDGDENSDIDWLTATRVEGDSVHIAAQKNISDTDRSATVTFFNTENPNIRREIVVHQEAGSYLKVPVLLFGTSKSSKIINCPVDANIPWTAVSNDSWINISSTTETAVVLAIDENTTGTIRAGTVTISSPVDPVRFTFTVTVNQDELGELTGFETPVEWEFSADHYNAGTYISQFVNSNALKSGTGSATATGISTISYMPEGGLADFPNNANVGVRIIGTTGHPYINGGWPGDYWLFKVPVTNLRPGIKINIKYLTRTSATGHKYWMLECYDGNEWKVVGQTTIENVSGLGEVTYTHAMNADGSTNVQVNSTYTFTNPIISGDVQFRFRCMANWRAQGGTLAAPNTGTSRIVGAADGTSPVISIVQ